MRGENVATESGDFRNKEESIIRQLRDDGEFTLPHRSYYLYLIGFLQKINDSACIKHLSAHYVGYNFISTKIRNSHRMNALLYLALCTPSLRLERPSCDHSPSLMTRIHPGWYPTAEIHTMRCKPHADDTQGETFNPN